MEKKVITIYTDGACSGNPGPGGWAAILKYLNREKIIQGWCSYTTNNRMELLAPIRALEVLEKMEKYPYEIHIFSDSQYLRNGITQWIYKWKKNNWVTSENKTVKNIDLWKKLDEFSGYFAINWEWIKGHATNNDNIRVDKLAKDSILLGKKGELTEDKLGLIQ